MYFDTPVTLVCQGFQGKVSVNALLHTSRAGVTVLSVLFPRWDFVRCPRLLVTPVGRLLPCPVDRLFGAPSTGSGCGRPSSRAYSTEQIARRLAAGHHRVDATGGRHVRPGAGGLRGSCRARTTTPGTGRVKCHCGTSALCHARHIPGPAPVQSIPGRIPGLCARDSAGS
jgi:hypothetical protein